MEAVVSVRLSEQKKQQFNKICKSHGATPSSYARLLIEQYLENVDSLSTNTSQ